MYPDDPSRWHCFTRCDEDERDGDIVDLIQRLEGGSFHEALAIAVRIAEPEENEPVDQGSDINQIDSTQSLGADL